jgi:broad specificity phosphatase PhoE
MTLIYLIRHGATEWNISKGRYCGSGDISDIDLSPLGVAQAEALAERLKGERLDAVYSSSMKRAVKTAEKLARPHGLKVSIMDALKERSYGRWEGLTVEEIEARYPGDYSNYEDDPGSFSPPDGESGLEVGKRVAPVLDLIAERHGDGVAAVVAHEAVNRILLCMMLGINVSHYRRKLVQSNAALTVVEYHHGKWKLLLYNDTGHLKTLS